MLLDPFLDRKDRSLSNKHPSPGDARGSTFCGDTSGLLCPSTKPLICSPWVILALPSLLLPANPCKRPVFTATVERSDYLNRLQDDQYLPLDSIAFAREILSRLMTSPDGWAGRWSKERKKVTKHLVARSADFHLPQVHPEAPGYLHRTTATTPFHQAGFDDMGREDIEVGSGYSPLVSSY